MDVPRLAELASSVMGVKRAIPRRTLLRTTNAPAWCSTIRAVRLLKRAALWYYGRSPARNLVAGELCSIKSGDHFPVAKILATGPGIVHVRLYREKFRERPRSVATDALPLGAIDDPDGFGVGHLSLSRGSFGSWLPVLSQTNPVTDDEFIWVAEWE